MLCLDRWLRVLDDRFPGRLPVTAGYVLRNRVFGSSALLPFAQLHKRSCANKKPSSILSSRLCSGIILVSSMDGFLMAVPGFQDSLRVTTDCFVQLSLMALLAVCGFRIDFMTQLWAELPDSRTNEC